MMKYIQKLGKSMMLPVAALPICGILMGIGYFLCPSAMSQNVVAFDIVSKIGYLLVKVGSVVIDNMSILFVIGVAIGMSNDGHGSVCLAAIVSWLMITYILSPNVLSIIFPYIEENQTVNLAFQKISNPFIAILVGILSATCYNKYKNVSFVDALSFFSGRRFVIIVVAIYSFLLSVVLLIAWPVVFTGFVYLGRAILSLEGIGVGIYVFLNRLLIPSGLHHALNNVFWFDTIGLGDLTAYWAGKTSNDVTWDVGMYMSGFFPCMMFGVPGAALAIINTAKNKQKAIGLFASSALCAFICGLTEPFEFAFMFIAFPLYIVYSLLYGIFACITYVVGFRAGFTFSAGALDLLFSSSLPAAKNTLLIIPLGIATFFTYYFVFKFLIKKFKFHIVEDDAGTPHSGNQNNKAALILAALGGKNNISSIDCCATRLRVDLIDIEKASEQKIKEAGVLGFVKVGNNSCQVIVGLKVQQVLEEIRNIMNNNVDINVNNNISCDMRVKHGDSIDKFFVDANVDTQNEKISSGSEKCEFEYIVKLKNGMHARPAGKLVNIVKSNACKVNIMFNDKSASGDSITSIMALGITNGAKVKIVIEGSNVEKIKNEIEKCLSEEE